MCCCSSKVCCIYTLIILVLIGIVSGFGIYTRGFYKLTSNIHLGDNHHYDGSFRAYDDHLVAPPASN
jgi:hypothetical protein